MDDAQLFEFYGEFLNKPELKPLKPEFVDLSEADMTRVTTNGLVELSRMMKDNYLQLGVDLVKTAVYSPDDMPFGLARMYEAWSESSPELVRVFRNRQQAIEWLCE